jgi:hypothetical protein
MEEAVMQSTPETTPVSTRRRWTGRIIGTLAVLFLAFDSAGKLLTLPPVVEGSARLGFPESVVLGIGIIELVCIVAYLLPSTAVLARDPADGLSPAAPSRPTCASATRSSATSLPSMWPC